MRANLARGLDGAFHTVTGFCLTEQLDRAFTLLEAAV